MSTPRRRDQLVAVIAHFAFRSFILRIHLSIQKNATFGLILRLRRLGKTASVSTLSLTLGPRISLLILTACIALWRPISTFLHQLFKSLKSLF